MLYFGIFSVLVNISIDEKGIVIRQLNGHDQHEHTQMLGELYISASTNKTICSFVFACLSVLSPLHSRNISPCFWCFQVPRFPPPVRALRNFFPLTSLSCPLLSFPLTLLSKHLGPLYSCYIFPLSILWYCRIFRILNETLVKMSLKYSYNFSTFFTTLIHPSVGEESKYCESGEGRR